jgi:hypothetical protein
MKLFTDESLKSAEDGPRKKLQYTLYSTMSMFHEHVRAQHTVCTIAEMTSLHSLAYVALLAPNVDVDDDAAHRSGLDVALDEPEEEDGVRHLGPGADLGGGLPGLQPGSPP